MSIQYIKYQYKTSEVAVAGLLIDHARVAAMTAAGYGLIDRGAIAIVGDRVAWVGSAQDLPAVYAALPRADAGGRLVTPALIDCHTHLVYAGNRAREYELRLEGASYEEIARAGGGINATVQATRQASERELVEQTLRRADALIAEGVATIEIKSGYGLDKDTELRCLRVARALAKQRPVEIQTTFLGAHAIPPEYQGRADAYLAEICLPTLAEAHAEGLVDAVDGFCEGIAFTPAQIERVFAAARDLGLPVKLHAEQLSNLGGAALAARYHALSADHLEYLDGEGVAAMARAGTVAVLLPGAFYALRETRMPPVAALRSAGVPIAISTDSNPGSSPMTSPLLAMNMACTIFRLTPEEALAGLTRNAAKALGLDDRGMIAPGQRADLAVWDAAHPAELAYHIGFNPLYRRVFGGSDAEL
jgi:imidazolonepropionase